MHLFEGKGIHIYSTPTHMAKTGYYSTFIIKYQIKNIFKTSEFNLVTILRDWYLLSSFYWGRNWGLEKISILPKLSK